MLFRLRGKLTAGMFPNERVVVIEDFEGHKYALILPEDMVVVQGPDGLIEVRLVAQDKSRALVRLPGEVMGPDRTVTVRKDQLEPVPA